MTAGVIQFPPLPPLPAPPQLSPDPRQARGLRMRKAFDRMLSAEGEPMGINLSSGYHASAVDLAALKGALESGLRSFTSSQLAERWEVDVQAWVTDLLRCWIQRARIRAVSLEGSSIQIRVETEDDAGHYAYELDVFPGR